VTVTVSSVSEPEDKWKEGPSWSRGDGGRPMGLWHGGVYPTHKTQDDAGGDPGALRGGWTTFLGWHAWEQLFFLSQDRSNGLCQFTNSFDFRPLRARLSLK
jgi:hypothetical protein